MTAGLATDAGTVAVTLRDAASYLDRHGWIQGSYYDMAATLFTPAACMVGAIGIVCFGGPVDAPAQMFDDPGFADFEVALAFLELYVIERFDVASVYDFNDAKARTAAEVIRVLGEAAELWEQAFGGAR